MSSYLACISAICSSSSLIPPWIKLIPLHIYHSDVIISNMKLRAALVCTNGALPTKHTHVICRKASSTGFLLYMIKFIRHVADRFAWWQEARCESGSTRCSSVYIAVSIRFLLAFRGGCWVFQFVLWVLLPLMGWHKAGRWRDGQEVCGKRWCDKRASCIWAGRG